MRALFFLLLRRLASRLNLNPFARDSHRKSGVLSFVALLSPVDSCNPPGAQGAHNLLVRPGDARRKRKEKKNEATIIPGVLRRLSSGFPGSSSGMRPCFEFGRGVSLNWSPSPNP
jgi:hypothetical protein